LTGCFVSAILPKLTHHFQGGLVMSAIASESIDVSIDAYRHAFQAGQAMETLILERSRDQARKAGCSVATLEHVRASIDEIPLDQLKVLLDVRSAQAPPKAA
jgi:hypothetical protein